MLRKRAEPSRVFVPDDPLHQPPLPLVFVVLFHCAIASLLLFSLFDTIFAKFNVEFNIHRPFLLYFSTLGSLLIFAEVNVEELTYKGCILN